MKVINGSIHLKKALINTLKEMNLNVSDDNLDDNKSIVILNINKTTPQITTTKINSVMQETHFNLPNDWNKVIEYIEQITTPQKSKFKINDTVYIKNKNFIYHLYHTCQNTNLPLTHNSIMFENYQKYTISNIKQHVNAKDTILCTIEYINNNHLHQTNINEIALVSESDFLKPITLEIGDTKTQVTIIPTKSITITNNRKEHSIIPIEDMEKVLNLFHTINNTPLINNIHFNIDLLYNIKNIKYPEVEKIINTYYHSIY